MAIAIGLNRSFKSCIYHQAKSISNITSPTAGFISDTSISVGDYVQAGESLARISNHTALEIKYELASRYENQVQLGQTVRFYPVNMPKAFTGQGKSSTQFISKRINHISP